MVVATPDESAWEEFFRPVQADAVLGEVVCNPEWAAKRLKR
jgi:hypothetical protein